jgi:hypothetical protein
LLLRIRAIETAKYNLLLLLAFELKKIGTLLIAGNPGFQKPEGFPYPRLPLLKTFL